VVIDIDRHEALPPARHRLLPGIAIPDSIDLTGLSNGFHTLGLLAALRRAIDPAEDETTLRVRTPSGGLHVWYRSSSEHTWLCSTGSSSGRALAWQVDVRATGGYIVAPGTVTSQGVYTPMGHSRTPASLPEWLVQDLARTGHLQARPPRARITADIRPHRARQAVIAAGGGRDAASRTFSEALAAVLDCGSQSAGTGFSDKLNRAAFTAGGLVAAGYLQHADAEQRLLDAAFHIRPGQERRSTQIVRNGMSAGALLPLRIGDRR
jgi:hypothetical protein